MQIFWVLATCCLAVTALEVEERQTNVSGQNGWYVPQIDGTFKWVDVQTKVPSKLIMKQRPVNFFLYTSSDPDSAQRIYPTDEDIEATTFDPSALTVVSIHGYMQTRFSSNVNRDLRQSYFKMSNTKLNFIFTEWPDALHANYLDSADSVSYVGQKLAEMIDALRNKFGDKTIVIHLVGHSLGAHVSGFAGKYVKTGPIERITALNTALPGFRFDNPAGRLNSTDAELVISIHTDAGALGFNAPIGSLVCVFDDGKSQPGCFTHSCNHESSVTYHNFIISNFLKYLVAMQCRDYDSAAAKNCSGELTYLPLGDMNNMSLEKGIFHIPLTNKSPYVILTDKFIN